MIVVEVLRLLLLLSPESQLALIISCTALVFLLACNRSAGRNLFSFVRQCYLLLQQNAKRQSSKNKESITHSDGLPAISRPTTEAELRRNTMSNSPNTLVDEGDGQ